MGGGWSKVLKEKKRKTSLVNGSAKLSRLVFAEMWILIWPILIPSLSAFPVFTFNGTTASSAGPSFAYLDKDLQLPGKFILCSSVKQARFDNVGFYSVSRRDSQEWIKLKIETFVKTTRLIIYWKGNFHKLGKPISPKIDFWYHICFETDIQTNEIKFAVNGKVMGSVHEKNMTNIPTKLKMKIGVDKDNQFQGSVANIEVFSDGSIVELSAFPCKRNQSALLIWNPESWKVVGSELLLTEEFENTFCIINDNYNLAIASLLTFKEGMDLLRKRS